MRIAALMLATGATITLRTLVGPAGNMDVTRKIVPAETHSYTIARLDGGDVLSGRLDWRGSCTIDPMKPAGCTTATISFLDGAGKHIKSFEVWKSKDQLQPDAMQVGFVAPGSGPYEVRVSAAPMALAASYHVELQTRPPTERLKNTHIDPRDDYTSPRISQLMSQPARGLADAEVAFWKEVAQAGSPLIEPLPGSEDAVLATFLWKATYPTYNVLVQWPPAASRAEDYYMSNVPGTGVWYKTVRAWAATRVPYTLSPNDHPKDRDFTTQADPLNPRLAYGNEALSLFELPGAPDEKWVLQTPPRTGTLRPLQVRSSLLNRSIDTWVYTPPDYDQFTSRPLVVLFNGYMYLFGVEATKILDNLVGEGKIRGPVVCFVNMPDPSEPIVVQSFPDAVANELLPHLRSAYRTSTSAKDTVLGGFSAGAGLAAHIALQHPDKIGNVLAQSGAFIGLPWLGQHPSLPTTYAQTPRADLRFYMDTGLYEPVVSARAPIHEMAVTESLTVMNRHFRDVLLAKGYSVIYRETAGAHDGLHTRAVLPDALISLLGPK